MEDLALLVSLMLFVPIAFGLVALVLAVVYRAKGKLKKTAIGFTAVVGLMAGFGLAAYAPLGVAPLILMATALIIIYIPKR
ncbi:MAG: hypothetical protein RLZZ06_939 [Actinomycetota bacterium]|jgi:hypothetical protein